jgi:hypothetical protein
VRCTALAARRAETYWIKSASFRTSGKEIVTWFGQNVCLSEIGVMLLIAIMHSYSQWEHAARLLDSC